MVKAFLLVTELGKVKSKITQNIKIITGLEILFLAFLFQTAYTFLSYGTIGFDVVAFGFFAISGVVIFVTVLPYMTSLSGVLAELQSKLISSENSLSPAEIEKLKSLLPIIEDLLKAEGLVAGNKIDESASPPK